MTITRINPYFSHKKTSSTNQNYGQNISFSSKISSKNIFPDKDTFIKRNTVKIKSNTDFGFNDYDVYDGRKKVGTITYVIEESVPICDTKTFPQNWLTTNKTLKPHLNLQYIEILPQERGKGYARKTIQKLYEISKKEGGGGRIILDSSPNAKGFYSHLGFDIPLYLDKKYNAIYNECLNLIINDEIDCKSFCKTLHSLGGILPKNGKFSLAGLRYFNPTKNNLKFLFSEK